MEKKYKFTDETVTFGFVKLHRIEALRSFGNVRKGDKGGFIESEDNLSHEGYSWVYNEAKVCGKAKVLNNARVHNHAIVGSHAEISNDAIIMGHAFINGLAKIYGYTTIKDYARVGGKVTIGGLSSIRDHAKIYGNAKLEGCSIRDHARIYGNAKIESCIIGGSIEVCDDVTISKEVKIEGIGRFEGNAVISSNKDYIIFKNWWSSGRYFTWTRSNNMWSVGCFYGTGKELIEKAYKDSELSGREYERIVKYVESILNE